MDFKDIEKADKEAFDGLLAHIEEPNSIKNVSGKDAPQLIETLEQLHRYLVRVKERLLDYSEILKIDVKNAVVHLTDITRKVGRDIEFLKRKP